MKKFYNTRFEDVPLEIIVNIFAWIPLQTVFQYRRLSKTINQCLLTRQFAVLSMQTADFQRFEQKMVQIWFHLPENYQAVVASAMSAQLKSVQICVETIETKGLPESITRLTAVETIFLYSYKLTGKIPDGIGALQSLTYLDLRDNYLTGPLPISFNLVVALDMLDLTNNQLAGEFPALPSLHALECLCIDGNHTIPATISTLTTLWELRISENSFACQVPPGIWNMQNLTWLDMSNCKLSGLLAGVGNLWQLERLDVSNNRFSGELPSRKIRSLEYLEDLHLIGNDFSGDEILDVTGSKLCTMCVDADIHVVWQEEYLCSCQHELIEDS
ncbi:hypothetical protein HDU81_005910 [Chytriomyces hyalinus]|nr:hypothetical protein HDU81_005910 [Chytriomyces hyalinus]